MGATKISSIKHGTEGGSKHREKALENLLIGPCYKKIFFLCRPKAILSSAISSTTLMNLQKIVNQRVKEHHDLLRYTRRIIAEK